MIGVKPASVVVIGALEMGLDGLFARLTCRANLKFAGSSSGFTQATLPNLSPEPNLINDHYQNKATVWLHSVSLPLSTGLLIKTHAMM